MKESIIKQQAPFTYHIIWQLSKGQAIREQDRQVILAYLERWQKEVNVQIVHSHIEEQVISVVMESKKQLEGHKVFAKLQVALARSVGDAIGQGNQAASWQSFLLTSSTQPVAADKRLGKLLESVQAVEYYDLDEGMTDEEIVTFKSYLGQQRLSVIDTEEEVYLVDTAALDALINLQCFACTKAHRYGCCGGSPCSMSRENRKRVIDGHKEIVACAAELSLDEKQYKTLHTIGSFFDQEGEIKEIDGHCALLVEEGGVGKCLVHHYARSRQLPIYEWCPLSCLMYPLEIIELVTAKQRRLVLFTAAITDEFATAFSRWGSYQDLGMSLRCLVPNSHDEVFLQKDYEPVYAVNKGIITYMAGERIYDLIQEAVETSRQRGRA